MRWRRVFTLPVQRHHIAISADGIYAISRRPSSLCLLLRGRDKVRPQRLRDAGLSKYEPEPLAAITDAEQRQPAKGGSAISVSPLVLPVDQLLLRPQHLPKISNRAVP